MCAPAGARVSGRGFGGEYRVLRLPHFLMPDDSFDPLPLAAGLLAAAAAALAVRAFVIEPTQIQITRQELPVPDLPPEWAGARMIHLSDIHWGDPRSRWLFRWMVETVNELEPDLIVITGDFVRCLPSEVAPCAEHLALLRSKHGIVAVYGDHDYRKKPLRLMEGLEAALLGAGVRIFKNGSCILPGGLRIACTEPTTRKVWKADLEEALRGLGGAPPHLLLSHSPDILPDAVKHDIPLVLCGHTHGGQVVAPGYGAIKTHTRVGRPHASGWSSRGKTRMYTNRGLASHYSLRFLCLPELAVFTLVPAEASLPAEPPALAHAGSS